MLRRRLLSAACRALQRSDGALCFVPCATDVCTTSGREFSVSHMASSSLSHLGHELDRRSLLSRSLIGQTASVPFAARRLFGDAASINGTAAKDILRQIAVRKLCQWLQEQAEDRVMMSSAEVIEAMKRLQVTSDAGEASKIIDALHTSGIVIRHENKVYLRADEVADLVIRALPDTVQEAEERVAELEHELKPLTEELRGAERTAISRSDLVAYFGLVLLIAQTLVYFRLTYWELSWDVMEPVSYFTGQAGVRTATYQTVQYYPLEHASLRLVVMMYIYYLIWRTDFSYEQHFSRLTQTQKARLLANIKFDEQLYRQKVRDLARWRRFARHMKGAR